MNTPPKTRHERRRMLTRQLLTQATLELILEKGYESIAIQDITDRADLGRGTFYIHFKDKEAVVWAAFQDLFQDFERDAHQKIDRTMPQMEYYGLLNIFCHVEKNQDLYRIMFGRQGSTALTARAQDFLAQAFAYDIQHAPKTPEPNFNLPEEIEAQILTGIITRLIFWWLENPTSYTPRQMAAMAYEALYQKIPPDTSIESSRRPS